MTLVPRSLRGRLLASAVVFIALALLTAGVAVDFALHRFVQGQIDQRLDSQLLTLADALEQRPDGTILLNRNVDGPPFDNPKTGWFWLVRTPTHRWMSAGLRGADLHLPEVPLDHSRPPRTIEGVGPEQRRILARAATVRVGDTDVETVAAAPLEAVRGPLRDAFLPLAASMGVLGLGLVFATLIQVRIGLRPLAALRDALAAVRTGGLARLPVDQPSEVVPLVGEINTLLDQHAANLERARRHTANLAHALKTPLASLSLALDAPECDPDGSLHHLTATMDRRIRHHLARARAAALGASARASTPVAARLADHMAAFSRIYADKGVACAIHAPPDLAAACDPQDFDEIVGNLLDNGFKWARATLRVEAEAADRLLRITVEDDGPGVRTDEIQRVLQPGQRLDEQVSGDGFGLAIVQELTELYGGTVRLAASRLGGLRVDVTLPSR